MFGTTQIWQHRASGEWFLVRISPSGEIVYTNGPLPSTDCEYCINHARGDFDGTDEDNDWFTEWSDEFELVYE